MSVGGAVAAALSFVWLGMVCAISFLEAPLKFRAPGVTLQIGLGIGRLVFRALNRVEILFAILVLVALVRGRPSIGVIVTFGIVVGTLLTQLLVVRPRLTRRSDAVLAGEHHPRSRGHHAYVVLELPKAIALAVGGILLVSS
jgi:hypothetical protein